MKLVAYPFKRRIVDFDGAVIHYPSIKFVTVRDWGIFPANPKGRYGYGIVIVAMDNGPARIFHAETIGM